jgi:hypothetical protein
MARHHRSERVKTRRSLTSTGFACQATGLYRGTCRCAREIALRRGKTFPPCHNCYRATTWRMVRPMRFAVPAKIRRRQARIRMAS